MVQLKLNYFWRYERCPTGPFVMFLPVFEDSLSMRLVTLPISLTSVKEQTPDKLS